jgi:myo-inositol-1(or 4)-monophosphatase
MAFDDDAVAVAVAAAHAAGVVLQRAQAGALEISTKSNRADLVTNADVAAERVVLDHLRARFPGDAIVAEESGTSGDGRRRWMVDPLDGTTNFAHRFPHFSVSIALVDGDEPEVGVVHDPMRGETFVARRGAGAWLQTADGARRRLVVTEVSELADALVTTGFGVTARDRDKVGDPTNLAELAWMLMRTRGIRRLGSAALDLAWTAAGRVDAYWEYHLSPWDWAAGALLVREAGGVVTTIEGGPWRTDGSSIAVAGPTLHPLLTAALADARERWTPRDPSSC